MIRKASILILLVLVLFPVILSAQTAFPKISLGLEETENPTDFILTIQNKTDKAQEPELFLINHKINGRNVSFTEIIWFKPYQGIVKLEKKQGGRWNSIDESWELIESNVKITTFGIQTLYVGIFFTFKKNCMGFFPCKS